MFVVLAEPHSVGPWRRARPRASADEPYDKVKRALKAKSNEEAWATLYSTVSRPFDPPETGKIAMKVINHYGDEVLKVLEVGG